MQQLSNSIIFMAHTNQFFVKNIARQTRSAHIQVKVTCFLCNVYKDIHPHIFLISAEV